MPRYYAAISGLIPHDFSEEFEVDTFSIMPRRWEVSLWDWAELQSKHKLHLPFTVADSILKRCNLEISFLAESAGDAKEKLSPLHLMLYANRVHPFSVQLISSHSINEYAGINNRKSESGRSLLPEGLRDGITTSNTTVEVWPAPYNSGARFANNELQHKVSREVFAKSVEDASRWIQLRERNPTSRFLEKVALTAPTLPDVDLSLLHSWTGLEALFPKVQTEVSFRLALYLSQLHAVLGDRMPFFQRARTSYNDRSKVAHGGELKKANSDDRWLNAWLLLMDSILSILARGLIPSEEELVVELLKASDQSS
ncbi:hypothetical protein [Amycolatopsis sp. CB00013]|uniref:hypothetical protein n=1 Tax=Amycolatopsis sp. CB00013 TaxID=1703945 RepID=UPI001160FFCE|nr:hypothetical protein [Amycolatopsis sp. CB00013]